MKIKLAELVAQLSPDPSSSGLSAFPLDQEISRITADSRRVEPGTLFVAVRGLRQDGHEFADEVFKKGAVMMIGERPAPIQTPNNDVALPYLQVPNSQLALAHLAAQFYGFPSNSLLVIGVTGTSGKTTTTYLIESILKAAGHEVGVIGTVNCRYGAQVFPSEYTSPGPVETQDLLYQMKRAGCTAVVMEVSSHALQQNRLASVAYDGMIFTNLSPEHLDYHSDMEDYFRAKSILFQDLAEYAIQQKKRPVAAVNADDAYGARLIANLTSDPRWSVSPHSVQKFSLTSQLKYSVDGIQGLAENIRIQSPLVGQFNCYNILAAVTLARGLGIAPSAIERGIAFLRGVPGRLEKIENSRGVHVWVDYAHKADALEKVLKALNEIRDGHPLITVVGCGGDRDRLKRPLMGRIAVEKSNFAWITSDNPRTEDPLAIIQEILRGVDGHTNYSVEPDRKAAILNAIQSTKRGDLVLIAGKGHENYQILGTKKIHFDDCEIAREGLREST